MPKEKLYYVYILSSRSRAIYVGMTGFLMARVISHRAGEASLFTRKYRIHRLVYYEIFHSVAAAIARETEIKRWRREKKVALIVQKNPTWEDLAARVGTIRCDESREQSRFLTGPPARFGMTSLQLTSNSPPSRKSNDVIPSRVEDSVRNPLLTTQARCHSEPARSAGEEPACGQPGAPS